ncbi:HAD superfamily hydrolase (TIGR01509 family) [Deinobacterium chartae]|uniref:HAD superfamily hydrolase (TIGR01509 family) n=1 Tax=Deinobacterium chartae TaxID=521158 RepID=A0A841I309_9DEIO|nr:HAD-IA family hydrolase [Deinobacterium chartae]MBB6098422.1 HAD superfamily hydrolase (TIGR01509 family) [Deinobacterium chartae]
MPITAIFLDDGGVLNDNARRALQWRRWLGEFLPRHLGGRAQDWSEANLEVAARLFDGTFLQRHFGARREDVSFLEWERAYALEWLGGMCERMGRPLPDEADRIALMREAHRFVTGRVRAGIPGAAQTLRALHARGYRLYTASYGPRYDLEGHVATLGAGIRELFTELYGADLVNLLKESAEYYRRVFAHAGEDPAEALVLDDSPDNVRRAEAAGARAVLVAPVPVVGVRHRVAALTELPALLQAWEAGAEKGRGLG